MADGAVSGWSDASRDPCQAYSIETNKGLAMVRSSLLVLSLSLLVTACGGEQSSPVDGGATSDGDSTSADESQPDSDSETSLQCVGGDPILTEPFVITMTVENNDASLVDVWAQTGHGGGSWPVWLEITDPEGNPVPPMDACAQFCGEPIPGCFAAGAVEKTYANLTNGGTTGSISAQWDNLLRPSILQDGQSCLCREPAPEGTYGAKFCVLGETNENEDPSLGTYQCFEAQFDYPGDGTFEHVVQMAGEL
jgi:hypothetical protein